MTNYIKYSCCRPYKHNKNTHVNVNAGIQVPEVGLLLSRAFRLYSVVDAASHQVWTNITSSNEGRKYWSASEYVDVWYLLVFFADPDHCTLIPTPFVSPSDSSRGTPRHRGGKIIAKNRELCTRCYCKLLSTSTGSCYIQQSCDAASAPTWLPEVSLWPRPPLHHFLPLRKLLHTDLPPVGRSHLSDSSRANVYKQDDFTADYRLSSS